MRQANGTDKEEKPEKSRQEVGPKRKTRNTRTGHSKKVRIQKVLTLSTGVSKRKNREHSQLLQQTPKSSIHSRLLSFLMHKSPSAHPAQVPPFAPCLNFSQGKAGPRRGPQRDEKENHNIGDRTEDISKIKQKIRQAERYP